MSKIIPYGYLRVSSLEQVKHTRGLDSQDDAVRTYINNHSDIFDTEKTVMMSDAAMSAYSGKQISDGELGRFLGDVEAGKIPTNSALVCFREGANKRGNSSRLTQSFHFFMFEPIFSPVNALNQPI